MRSWRRQGWKATSPSSKSEIPKPIAGLVLLLIAFVFFWMGFQFINPIAVKYGGWFFAPILWFLAFLCFLGFLRAIITKKEKPSPVYHYELEMPPQYWVPRQEDEKQNEEKNNYNKDNGGNA